MRSKSSGSRRVKTFQVRLNTDEYEALQQAADQLRVSKGELLRQGARLLAANQARKLASGE